jgi:hypothetical protein
VIAPLYCAISENDRFKEICFATKMLFQICLPLQIKSYQHYFIHSKKWKRILIFNVILFILLKEEFKKPFQIKCFPIRIQLETNICK